MAIVIPMPKATICTTPRQLAMLNAVAKIMSASQSLAIQNLPYAVCEKGSTVGTAAFSKIQLPVRMCQYVSGSWRTYTDRTVLTTVCAIIKAMKLTVTSTLARSGAYLSVAK